MKKFFAEFKKFISRGSVMDMAVGTIIGAAFTAIVTALSNGILKPVINMIIYYCCGGNQDALAKMYTVLVGSYVTDAETGAKVLDTANSIYIDWGAFISAIINFLLVALVLFVIIKAFNQIKDATETINKMDKRVQYKLEKGLKLSKKEQAYVDEKKRLEALKANEEPAQPVVADDVKLLTEIRDLLANKK